MKFLHTLLFRPKIQLSSWLRYLIRKQILFPRNRHSLMMQTSKIISSFPLQSKMFVCIRCYRFSGYFSDVLTLNFEGDWKIGCMLDIYVDIEEAFKSKRECPTQNETRSRYDQHTKRNTALK